ncbi:MAG: C-GCAxxG-C-C family protein [Candidatus Thorarchaeota archaeon]
MTDETVKNAHRYFDKDHNCAQAVIRSVLEKYDMHFEEATATMAAMGGGVGLQGNVCGAVIGAVAALGVLNTSRLKDVEKHKQASYTSAAKFIYKFKKMHETVICDELTGVTMADNEARTAASDKGHFHKICPKYVEDAVRIALDMESNV